MTAVGISDGISYGAEVIMYVVGLAAASNILFGFALLLIFTESLLLNILGALLMITAFAVSIAGLAGLLYKVIADAVSRGNRHSIQSDQSNIARIVSRGNQHATQQLHKSKGRN